MKIKKLNMAGVSHDILIVAFVAIFAIAGVAYLVASHADNCPVVSGAMSGPVSPPVSEDVSPSDSSCIATSGPVSVVGNKVGLDRLWNPTIQDHFYTDNLTEEKAVDTYYGYHYETMVGLVYQDQVPGSVPLLRAYNPKITDHFYTDNVKTLNTATQLYGYRYEGVEGYVMPTQTAGTVPLYRLYSAQRADHFYTTNAAEMQQAESSLGYKYEGIEGYVFSVPNKF